MPDRPLVLSFAALILSASPLFAADAPPTREAATAALAKATKFFHEQVAHQGGYLYSYSGDLALREGEGVAASDTIWVQPPGTPAVGEAFLDAFEATGDKLHLKAARATGRALVLGQLHSGGWYYSIGFDPESRRKQAYRYRLDWQKTADPVKAADRAAATGWDAWKRRKYEGNLTILDDDVTQAAVRFLMRLDRTLQFQDETVHEAALYCLKSLLRAQYPNGAWSASYDRFQEHAPSEADYPVKPASYPETWPRTWPKDFTGCYVTNDDLIEKLIRTMLLAGEVYEEEDYLVSAKKAGDFLLLAQMPDPQPAWAQQYDREMHPVWSRAFEPSAISGRESQSIMDALLLLTRKTGEKKYFAPLPRAIAYFRKSRLPDGRLSRFYELQTNRPLYFTRGQGGKGHVMTYENDRLASNYGFLIEFRLDAMEAQHRRLQQADAAMLQTLATEPAEAVLALDAQQVAGIIAALDSRGAWVERLRLRHHKVEPPSGVIHSQTFADNVRRLSHWIRSQR